MPDLAEALTLLQQPDVRRLAWAMGSASLFDAAQPVWQGRLRDDQWSANELNRCFDELLRLEHHPEALSAALGDPRHATPLGHTFEKLILFWQSARPDVAHATRGIVVRSGSRTVGEFDVVMLRHDGVIETLEVTVKYYLNLRPDLGIAGCIGPRAFDRMTEKFSKMTTRQTALGDTEAGRLAICRWLANSHQIERTPDQLTVENYALARGYVFHPAPDSPYPVELSSVHGRGLWQTDSTALPAEISKHWRNLAGREWLGDYLGPLQESDWPNDPAMPRMFAALDPAGEAWAETERRFVVRAESGLLHAADPDAPSRAERKAAALAAKIASENTTPGDEGADPASSQPVDKAEPTDEKIL